MRRGGGGGRVGGEGSGREAERHGRFPKALLSRVVVGSKKIRPVGLNEKNSLSLPLFLSLSLSLSLSLCPFSRAQVRRTSTREEGGHDSALTLSKPSEAIGAS